MDIWQSLAGMLEVKLLCGDPNYALKQIMNLGISIFNAKPAEDGVTLQFSISRSNRKILKSFAEKKGYTLQFIRHRGQYWNIKRLTKRPVLIFGAFFFLFLGLYLPSRVLFFQVEGNQTVPSKLILSTGQLSGIGFGCSREEVRSEKVKNALLEAIPELKWVGVNTSGCTAIISVQERTVQEKAQSTSGVSSIVASRDGIISSCTATKGNLLCKPGQAVTKGQVLISGYYNSGLTIQVSQAEGEVYAFTNREFEAVLPKNGQAKGEIKEVIKKYSLIIEKNRINFYKDSGISPTGCDKMYEENFMVLPGGFVLPVSFVTETWYVYETWEEAADTQDAENQLSEFAGHSLSQTLIAGKVLKAREEFITEETHTSLRGTYACLEMIGQVKQEEIVSPYGK